MPLSPHLTATLTRLFEAARAAPGGEEDQLRKSLRHWLGEHPSSRFQCLACPDAVLLVHTKGVTLGACKQFVSLPRNEDELGFNVIAMHCTGALEPLEGTGRTGVSWDKPASPQPRSGRGPSEAERPQQQTSQAPERNRG